MDLVARVDRATHIPPEAMTVTPPIPRGVKIELSPLCNYRCAFCALRARAIQPTQAMDFSLFREITANLAAAGVQDFGPFFLGEPFTRPHLLLSAVAYLKRQVHAPYVFLTSNASLAFPSFVAKLFEEGLDSLKWSVNAADPAQYQALLGVGGGGFQASLDHIRQAWILRERGGFPVRLAASSIHYDAAQIARMQPVLRDHILPHVDEHYWLPLYSMGDIATGSERQAGLHPTAGNTGRLEAPVHPLPCWSAFTAAHIRHTGEVTACCFDATGRWTMGDLTRQDFRTIWHGERFQALRDAHLRRDVRGTVCEECACLGEA